MVFADAARTLAAIAGLSGQFAGGYLKDYNGGYSPETIAGSSASGGADLGMLTKWPIQSLVGRGARYLNSRGVIKLPTDNFTGRLYSKGVEDSLKFTSIISWTYTVVEMVELTTGFGPAYEGDALKYGSDGFAKLSEMLRSAVPGEPWQGSGSEACAQLSATLQQLAVTVAGLDMKLADAVKGHAELVNHMRLGFGLLKDLLFTAMVIEMIIALVPAPAAAKAFAIAVAVAGIGAATGFIATLVHYSLEAGADAEDLMNQYNELLYQIGQKGQLTQTSAATSAESTVSDFQAISNSMSAGSAPSPRAFRAAEAPTTPHANTADAATTTTAAGIPSFALPAITMPSLAQVSTMSGQTARISGQLAQHVNLFNQAMGQVQQIAQMAQQNQPAPPPAPDTETATDVNAKTGDDTTAAADAPDGQRAPVEQTAPDTRTLAAACA
ncbi:EspA/EspE family type VII secretion system effector [Mycobacterium sp. 050134]|uniref:EspA/EspE family type VII secretion system effector n=1 Tax=Mycobacterium sp. 050134 TaxID=3096111 RepID=UPI002EDAD498